MLLPQLTVAGTILLGALGTSAATLQDARLVSPRALPNSPSGGYGPKVVDCPSVRPTVRSAGALSPEEASWLKLRRPATVQPMVDLLNRAKIADFDAGAYVTGLAANISALPNIGIAMSGGGYRALLNGAGFLAAADSRTPGATGTGGIGGLLQSATYLAGLSGGGWLVGSIYSNNFSSVVQLRDGSADSSVWRFENSIFAGPGDGSTRLSLLNTASYWADVAESVASKANAGFNTSITDYWGRALSYQLINATDGGPAYTFSSFAELDSFVRADTPFPLLVVDERAPRTKIVPLNSTVYEFGPFEMGSWDPTTFGFAPTKYLASNFSNGVIPPEGSCVAGFDQAGFVMGTSSSLFNTFLLENITTFGDVPSFVIDAVTSVLESLGDDNNDIAQYAPNPFLNFHPETNPSAGSTELTLVDGGEDLQNLPLGPLLQPLRAVDVIFAVDSSADTRTAWPNATALRATYERSLSPIANGTLFPPVPDAATFINLGLNSRPTFFGCDAANFTLAAPGQAPPPLLVYIPNAPYTAHSNFTTFTYSYTVAEKLDTIRNGFDAATQGNGTVDAAWPACLACAVLSRSLARTGTAVPAQCAECFARYCWNGTVDSRDPGVYSPGFIIGNHTTKDMSAGQRAVGGIGSSWLVVAVVLAGLLVL